MAFPSYIWLLLITALVVSSIGFKNYVWFISLGYGFSIAAEGILMLLLYRQGLSAGTVICWYFAIKNSFMHCVMSVAKRSSHCLQKEKGEAPFSYYTRFFRDVKKKRGVN